jgi:hypothetical protein
MTTWATGTWEGLGEGGGGISFIDSFEVELMASDIEVEVVSTEIAVEVDSTEISVEIMDDTIDVEVE